MDVRDLRWNKGITVSTLVDSLGKVGLQATELGKAVEIILKMKRSGATVFFTFTSNMVSSGLRGFFAQLIELGMIDVIVTGVGAVEEDIMKAKGEKFFLGDFSPDDIELYEKGVNRVGNIFIKNESYTHFEDICTVMLAKLYKKQARWPVSDMLKEIGLFLDDKDSFLFQAARKNVPVFCPGITDGSFGFHLYMLQQKHPDFVVDVVKDFANIIFSTSHDEKKGLISLGGGIAKHHAILAALINGGLDYAVYMTTSRSTSGSLSGATTDEAKSWGKIKDDSDAVTVTGDVSFTFPLAMMKALEVLSEEGILDG